LQLREEERQLREEERVMGVEAIYPEPPYTHPTCLHTLSHIPSYPINPLIPIWAYI